MRKPKFIYVPLIAIMLISMSMIVLTGCGSKKAAVTTAKAGGFDQSTMKKQIETSIQSLIDTKAITADQGTKIVTALTANTGRTMGQKPAGAGAKPTDGTPPAGGGTAPARDTTGGTDAGPGANGGGPFTSALTALVTDNTITQAQADAVTAKISTLLQGQGRQNSTTAQ